MLKLDIMSEINVAFGGKRFYRRNVVNALNLEDTRRANKLFEALKRNSVITKTSHKDFVFTEKEERISIVA